MILVVSLVFTGYATYNDRGDVLQEAHEVDGNAFLMVVLAHLVLIAALSLLRRQNQAPSMITGRVRGNGPNLVSHNRAWLAGLMLLAVVALGVWQWRDSPRGLIPVEKGSSSLDVMGYGTGRAGRNDTDDD